MRGSLSLSILLHGLLIACCIPFVFQHTNLAGITNAKIITTYFYDKPQQTKPTQQKILAKQGTRQSTEKKAVQSESLPYKNTKGYDTLLSHLHNLIEQHLVYPQSAIFAHQSGTATVGFDLQTNGQVKNIKLIKSSDTDSLDQAALNAVAAISPVNPLKIKSSEHFTVKVNFQEH